MRSKREGIHIRPVQAGDATSIAALCTQLGYPSRSKDVTRRLQEDGAAGLQTRRAVQQARPESDASGRGARRGRECGGGKRRSVEVEPVVFVAESPDGQVVGWVQACVRAVLVADRHAEVEGLVVDASWRGKGIGRALMKRAEQWARQRGCKVVRLRSNVVREGARPFYEALGYKVVKTQWAFRKTLGKQAVDRRRPRHPA